MDIPAHIFKSYDIRGLYPQELNEEFMPSITKAIVKFLTQDFKKERPFKILLSRDARLSSPALHKACVETLLNLGIEVLDIGISSTPTFYFGLGYLKADGGIQITASHNPKEYNGIKIVKTSESGGIIKIGKGQGMEEIRDMSIEGIDISSDIKGTHTEFDLDEILMAEVENALKVVGNPEIKPFKVVADPANAMGITYLDALFRKVPMEVVRMNFELDGTFPSHQANPLDYETLKELQQMIKEEKADLGIATDGDGDRCGFVDENGDVVPPSVVTALVAREILRENPGATIIADIRYILTVKKVVEENGGKFSMSKVGHAFITQQMTREDAVFAGESSMHYFFKASGYGEAQLPVILSVLAVMSREGKKMSEIVKELKRSYESGEINFEVKNAPEVIEHLKQKYSDGELETMDGIAITYPDWRFSVRSSNTEPVLRLNLEEENINSTGDKIKEVIEAIEEVAEKAGD